MDNTSIPYNLTVTMDTNNTNKISQVHNFDFECFTVYCIYELRYRLKHRLTLLLIAIILSILGVTGLIGNSFVIAVFARSKMKQTSIYFMVLLAIIDLMACCIVIPGIVVYEWRYKFHDDFLCKLWEFFRYFTIPTTAMVLVAIAFERFFIICLSPRRISKFVAKMIITFIIAGGISLGIPPVLGMGVYTKNYFDNSLVNYGYCNQNYLYISIDDLEVYWYFVTAIFLVMMVSIIFLYSAIFFKIIQQNKKWPRSRIIKIQPQNDKSSTVNQISKTSSDGVSVSNDREPVPHSSLILSTHTLDSQMDVELKTLGKAGAENLPSTSAGNKGQQIEEHKLFTRRISMGSENPVEDQNRPHGSKQCTTGGFKRTINTDPRMAVKDSQMKKANLNDNITGKNNNKDTGPINKQIQNRRMHVKTTQILFTVTIVYIISYVPTLLMSHNLVPSNRVIYLLYFINNAANPIIYSFMNPRFRQDLWKLLKCRST